eukprot:3454808-Rhodomonas_salina.2
MVTPLYTTILIDLWTIPGYLSFRTVEILCTFRSTYQTIFYQCIVLHFCTTKGGGTDSATTFQNTIPAHTTYKSHPGSASFPKEESTCPSFPRCRSWPAQGSEAKVADTFLHVDQGTRFFSQV